MGGKTTDLTGKTYGHTVVVQSLSDDGKPGFWLVRCGCGKLLERDSSYTKEGKRCRECGLKLTWAGARKHGMSGTSIHNIWMMMVSRCTKPTSKRWHLYGGRGITVCERWMKFENFLADMSERPSPKHSIDRIDNDGNYEPGNCRWATQSQQVRNRRVAARIEIDGVTKTLHEWADEFGISARTLRSRLQRKEPPHILSRPASRTKVADILAGGSNQ